MSSTVTISTGWQDVNASDTVKLVVVFTLSSGSGNTDVDASSNGIKVEEWGSIGWDYDIEDLFLVPGEFDCTLADKNGVLLNYFFTLSGVDRAAQVLVYVNHELEFDGKIDQDSIRYDRGNRRASFRATSGTELLNKQSLFDDENVALNPLGYNRTSYYRAERIIEDIFKKVDDGLSVVSGRIVIDQNWTFGGPKEGTAFPFVYGILFSEIWMHAELLFFGGNWQTYRTLGDVMRQMCMDYGCFAGVIHNQKAFFKRLFHHDATNLQTLGTVLQWESTCDAGQIDYVEVEVIGTDEKCTQGVNSFVEGRFIKRKTVVGFAADASFTNIRAKIARGGATDGWYWIYRVKDPDFWPNEGTYPGYTDIGTLLAAFWWRYRADPANVRMDRFLVSGVGYDFLKGFVYQGQRFQIIGMKKHIAQSQTEIMALFIGKD